MPATVVLHVASTCTSDHVAHNGKMRLHRMEHKVQEQLLGHAYPQDTCAVVVAALEVSKCVYVRTSSLLIFYSADELCMHRHGNAVDRLSALMSAFQ